MTAQVEANPMLEAMRPDENCPSLDVLSRLEDGSLAAAEAEAARQHVAGCAACQTEAAMLRSFLAAEAGPEEAADLRHVESRLRNPAAEQRVSPWWQRFLALPPVPRWAAGLAVLLLVAAGALQLRQMQRPGLEDGEAAGRVVRSASLALNGPKGDIGWMPEEFSWNPAEGASIYQVQVLEVDGAVLWEGQATSSGLAIPATLAEKILPKKTLLWQVTAVDPAGKVLAKSGLERFRLMP